MKTPVTILFFSSLFALRTSSGRRRTRSVVPRLASESLESRELLAAIMWSSGGDLPQPRVDATAVLGADNSVYVLGGNTTNVAVLSQGSTTWGVAAPIDKQRVAPGGAALADGRILVFGGQNAGQAIEETYLYDPTDSNSEDGAVMSTMRAQGAYATDPTTGLIYAFGGVDDAGLVLNSVEVYDPSTNSWSSLAPMPLGRADFTAAADGAGHIFTFGGRRPGYSNTDVTNSVHRYDIASNTWIAVAAMPVALRDATAVTNSNDGKIYIIGGQDATGVAASVNAYDYVTNTWSAEASLPVGVAAAAAVIDADGHVVVMGGRNSLGQAVSTVTVSQALNSINSVPAFVSAPPILATATVSYTYQVVATGNPQASLELITAPAGMTIDQHGLIRWLPDQSQIGSQSVTIRAFNIAGSVSQTYAITVASALPVITTVSAASGSTGVAYVYDVNATGDPQPTFSLTAAPAGMSINSTTGVISWTPGVDQSGSQTVTVVAQNTHGSDEQSFVITVADKTVPTAPTTLGVTGLSLTSVSLGWNPSSDNVGITKYVVYEQYKYGWRNNTTGYRILKDNILTNSTTVTGLVSGKAYNLAVVAVDAAGNQSLRSNVINTRALQLPTISVSGGGAVVATKAISLSVYAAGVAAPIVTLVSGPAGLTFDPTTRIATWTPSDSQVGNSFATFRATNSQGVADATVMITVTPNLPKPTRSFTYFGAVHSVPFAVEGDSFDLILNESFSASTIIWSVVSGPSGLAIDPNSGVVNWIPGTADVGTASMVFRATNYAGSSDVPVSVTVHPLGTDLRPPTTVSGISVSVIDSTRASVTWAPAIDNIGVESYRVTAFYTAGVGRTRHTVRQVFTAPGNSTMVEMSGLASRSQQLYIQAIDAAGNISPTGQTVTFLPTSNPLFPQIGVADGLQLQNAVAGVNRQIQIIDTNITPRTYAFVSAPIGATIHPTTGLISWTPGYGDTGSATITVRATNASGYRDLTISFPIFFTGPAQTVGFARTGTNSANATWTAPADTSHIAGYIVVQEWKSNGHTYSRTVRVDGASANRLDGLYIPGGAAFNSVRVYAIDSLGHYGLVSELANLI